MRLGILVATFVAFTAFSVEVVIAKGFFGFWPVITTEPFGLQLMLDLCIMTAFFGIWMVRDARKLGINGWLFVPLLSLGSIGALLYLIRREWLLRSKSGAAVATA